MKLRLDTSTRGCGRKACGVHAKVFADHAQACAGHVKVYVDHARCVRIMQKVYADHATACADHAKSVCCPYRVCKSVHRSCKACAVHANVRVDDAESRVEHAKVCTVQKCVLLM